MANCIVQEFTTDNVGNFKSVTFNNGQTIVNRPEVKVQANRTITVAGGGQHEIEPSASYDAMKKATVTVDLNLQALPVVDEDSGSAILLLFTDNTATKNVAISSLKADDEVSAVLLTATGVTTYGISNGIFGGAETAESDKITVKSVGDTTIVFDTGDVDYTYTKSVNPLSNSWQYFLTIDLE